MKWISEQISVGNIVTIIFMTIIYSFTAGVVYNAIQDDITLNKNTNDRQSHQIESILVNINQHFLEEAEQRTEHLSENNARYVSRELFDQYKLDLNARLDRIGSQIDRLIELQEGRR